MTSPHSANFSNPPKLLITDIKSTKLGALIQNDTPTSKMTPLLEKRNHIEFTCSLKLDKNIIVKTVIDLNFNRAKYESINYSSLLFGDKLFIILSMHFFLLSSFGCTYKFNVIEILL